MSREIRAPHGRSNTALPVATGIALDARASLIRSLALLGAFGIVLPSVAIADPATVVAASVTQDPDEPGTDDPMGDDPSELDEPPMGDPQEEPTDPEPAPEPAPKRPPARKPAEKPAPAAKAPEKPAAK